MSSGIVISAEDVCKRYRLGVTSHATLEKDLQSWWARFRGRDDPNARINMSETRSGKDGDQFWALQGVSFDVREGEVLGIIGRNGAGKSTLLKILSRVTAPTRGQIKVRGRIASLLEVGTGFHPDLTGRENIFLNGAILGMGRDEIRRKLDEIIAFSEIEQFIDTPVKRYSSGMYVRLAFAVAAHLEPEILIVDEVLAVGDAQFQKKCLGKMEDVGKEGRTVLFVSHNMGAISELCGRVIMLSDGKIASEGTTDEIIEAYLNSIHSTRKREVIRSKCNRFELKMPYWVKKNGDPVSGYKFGDDYLLRFEFNFFEPVTKINPGFAIREAYGRRIFTSHLLDDPDFTFSNELFGKVVIDTDINLAMLAPGNYEVIFGVRDENEINVLFSERELWLEINAIGPPKNGADGVLWHTSKWKLT
jgi:lipopolysaccharide transport system ATP-binding protein